MFEILENGLFVFVSTFFFGIVVLRYNNVIDEIFLDSLNEFISKIYSNGALDKDSESESEDEEEKYNKKYWDTFNNDDSLIELTDKEYDTFQNIFVSLINVYKETEEYKKSVDKLNLYAENYSEIEVKNSKNIFIPKVLPSKREELEKEAYEQVKKEKSKNLVNSVLLENTPLGNVAMYYDYESESFFYYSDSCAQSFKILDTVCRKYVCFFKCKYLYKNPLSESNEESDSSESNEESDSSESDEESEEEEEKPVNEGVFANLKGYNKTNNREKNEKQVEVERNRFTYRGKLIDFHLNKPTIKIKNAFTFSDFKNLKK
jgi:hypothetical protein